MISMIIFGHFWTFLVFHLTACGYFQDDDASFWIWRSEDFNYVESNSSLVIFQGDYLLPEANQPFVKRGPLPSEDLNSKDIALLVRVYSLGDVVELSSQLSYLIAQWRNIGVYVIEIQIDHDSPSGWGLLKDGSKFASSH